MLGHGEPLSNNGALPGRGRQQLTDGGVGELLVARTLLQDGAEGGTRGLYISETGTYKADMKTEPV